MGNHVFHRIGLSMLVTYPLQAASCTDIVSSIAYLEVFLNIKLFTCVFLF